MNTLTTILSYSPPVSASSPVVVVVLDVVVVVVDVVAGEHSLNNSLLLPLLHLLPRLRPARNLSSLPATPRAG